MAKKEISVDVKTQRHIAKLQCDKMLEMSLNNLAEKKDSIDYIFNAIMKTYSNDLKENIAKIPKPSVSLLVKTYYDAQQLRISSAIRSRIPNFKDDDLKKNPNGETKEQKIHRLGYDNQEVIDSLKYMQLPAELTSAIENYIKQAMDKYTDNFEVTRFIKSIRGIGPVISAALYAYLDITKAPTTGHFLRYGGWTGADDEKRVRGKKVIYNPTLRTLYWKIGCSFMKLANRKNSAFGAWYKYYVQMYEINNTEGKYKELAEKLKLELEQSSKQGAEQGIHSKAYKVYCEGKLTHGHLVKRACRTVVARFLSIIHDKWYMMEYNTQPPKPYVEARLGHTDIMPVDIIMAIENEDMPNLILDELVKLNRHAEQIGAPVFRFGEKTKVEADVEEELETKTVESDALREDE